MPKVNEIKRHKLIKLPIKQNGQNMMLESFVGKYTKDQIRDFVQTRTKAMKDAGFDGTMSVSLLY